MQSPFPILLGRRWLLTHSCIRNSIHCYATMFFVDTLASTNDTPQLSASPWRGLYSIVEIGSFTVATSMVIPSVQRGLHANSEFSTTVMPLDRPPQTQPAWSRLRSLIRQIDRRLADLEEAHAHHETPQLSQISPRPQISEGDLRLVSAAPSGGHIPNTNAQITSTLQKYGHKARPRPRRYPRAYHTRRQRSCSPKLVRQSTPVAPVVAQDNITPPL